MTKEFIKYSTGELMHILRKNKGLSQHELCYGLCSETKLSHIESGNTLPNSVLFELLVQRLGENIGNYMSIFLTKNRMSDYRNYERLNKLLFVGNHTEAKKVVAELENEEGFQEGFYRQVVLAAKAAFLDREEPIQAIALYREAIRITIPDFDENKVNEYHLSNEEASIINGIAISYVANDEQGRALTLLYALYDSLNSSYTDEQEKCRTYLTVIYNLTKCLGLSGSYQDAVTLCLEGEQACKRTKKYAMLPYIIYNHIWLLNELGYAFKNIQQLYSDCIYFSKWIGDMRFAESLESKQGDFIV